MNVCTKCPCDPFNSCRDRKTKTSTSPDWRKVRGSPKSFQHLKHFQTFHGNPFRDISAWTKAVDQLTEIAITRATLQAWLKIIVLQLLHLTASFLAAFFPISPAVSPCDQCLNGMLTISFHSFSGADPIPYVNF